MQEQPNSGKNSTISHWPSDERPREKLLTKGAESLSDAELLAIFIRTGVKGKTAVDIARDSIRQLGSLRQVLLADQHTFCNANGLGPAKYALIQAALEIGKRYLGQKLKHQGTLSSAKQAADFLTHQLRDQQREIFAIVYLDNRH